MNKASFNVYFNNVKTKSIKRGVDVTTLRVESDYFFLSSAQLVDVPKEREE